MIEVSGLSKRFGDVVALDNVSFTVEKGQIVGFLGANGAGKTTTMDIICGCIGADAGNAVIAGFDITEQPLEAKRRLGYLPDVPPLHYEMRVADFIKYAAKIHKIPGSEIPKRVAQTMDRLALADVGHRIIGNLSKGYRQRVALAQAIVHDPEVLVLDEPTEGLDPNQIVHIRELIRSLAGHHTIILSSHILSEVENTCDHLVIINKGRIVQTGRYQDLLARLEAGRIYRLRVGERAGAVASDLRSLGAVHNINATTEDELEFALKTGADESVLDEVAKKVVGGGYGFRELTLKTKTLEDVFFQLTN